jgi:hypothetical protein
MTFHRLVELELSPHGCAQMSTACLPGMLCPSFNVEAVGKVPDGNYSNYGFDEQQCEPG